MNEFNFDEFKKAWDSQQEALEKMHLIKDDEIKKMIEYSNPLNVRNENNTL